jgi:hypothetical protein
VSGTFKSLVCMNCDFDLLGPFSNDCLDDYPLYLGQQYSPNNYSVFEYNAKKYVLNENCCICCHSFHVFSLLVVLR